MGKHEHEYVEALESYTTDPTSARHCGCFGHLCDRPERHTAVRVGEVDIPQFKLAGLMHAASGVDNPFRRGGVS